jgi:hypothetical protein
VGVAAGNGLLIDLGFMFEFMTGFEGLIAVVFLAVGTGDAPSPPNVGASVNKSVKKSVADLLFLFFDKFLFVFFKFTLFVFKFVFVLVIERIFVIDEHIISNNMTLFLLNFIYWQLLNKFEKSNLFQNKIFSGNKNLKKSFFLK